MLRDLPPRPRSAFRPSYPRLAAALLAVGLSACGDNDTATAGSPPAPIFEDGRQCERDSDCRSGSCISEDAHKFAGGFVPQGICSTPCTDFLQGKVAVSPCGTDFACVADSPDAAVAQGWCLPRCTSGDASQCTLRTGWACAAQLDGGVCVPACSVTSSDCAPGVCDPESGLCFPAGTTFPGDPLGSPCDPAAEPDSCAGLCKPAPEDASVGTCTNRCRVGIASDCENGAWCAGVIPDANPGDLGYCKTTYP